MVVTWTTMPLLVSACVCPIHAVRGVFERFITLLNPLLHNVVKCQVHFKNLAAFPARFLKCV